MFDYNMIIDIAFYAIIGLALVGGLIGLWKGVWKTSFKLVFLGGLVVLFVFLTPTIARAVCTIDISRFTQQYITIGDTTITLTTVDETLCNVLIASGYVSPVASSTLYETALALAHSIVSYATFLVIMLLIWLIGPFFSMIFYHCLFKFIIPKKVRRRHKVRWLGFIFGAVETVVIFSMMLSPLTALVNIVTKENESIQKVEEKVQLNDPQIAMIFDILDAYSNSMLFQTLTLNGKTDGIDIDIVNKAIMQSVGEQDITFLGELQNILTVLGPVADSVEFVVSDGNFTIVISSLLADSVVSGAINMLKSSSFIMSIFPALVEVGLSYAEGLISDIDISKLDFTGVVWSDELSAIDTCYKSLYETGLITSIVDRTEMDFSSENLPSYQSAIKALGNTDIFKKISPIAIDMARGYLDDTGLNVLTTDDTIFDGIAWGDEFSDILGIAVGLCDVVDIDLSAIINQTESYDFATIFTDALKDNVKRPELLKYIVGEIAEESEPAAQAEGETEGGETEGGTESEPETEEPIKGLFDLQIFTKKAVDIPILVESGLNMVDGISDFIDPEEVIASAGNMTIAEWKVEINDLMSVVPYVIDNPNISFSDGASIDLKNPDTIADLKSIIDIVAESKLIKDLLPSVAEKAIGNSEFGSTEFFGITVSDFNFRVDDLKGELNKLLDIVPDALDLSDIASSGGSSVTDLFNDLDLAKVKKILNAFIDSQILNPDRTIDGTSNVTKNINLERLITGLLDQDSIRDSGIVLPSDLSHITWQDTLDDDGNVTKEGEITSLVNALQVIKDKALFLLEGGDIKVSELDSDLIVSLLDAIDGSELLRASITTILNNNVAPLLSDLGVDVDFGNVTDWKSEGRALGSLLDALNDLSDGEELDIANIDWLNLESDKLNALLTAYGKTSLAKVGLNSNGYYIDNLANLIYTVVGDANMTDLIGDVTYSQFATVSETTGESVGWSWIEETDTIEIQVGTETVEREVTTVGEIKNLVAILGNIKDVGMDAFTDNTATPEQLEALLYAVNESNVLSPMIPNVLETALAKIEPITVGTRSIDIGELNLSKFREGDKEYQNAEIGRLIDIYSYVQTDPDSGTSPLNELMDINNLDEEQLLTLEELLNNIYSIEMFSIPKNTERYSLFEQILGAMLNYSTIDALVVDVDDSDTAYSLMMSNIHANYATKEAALTENGNIIDVLRSITGLDLANITNTDNIDPETLSNLLKSLNKSNLMHAAIPGFLDEVLSSANLDSLLGAPLTEGGPKVVVHPLVTNVHLSTNAEDIAYWDNEIEQLVNLFEAIRDPDTGSIKDLSSLSIGGDMHIINILAPIDQMALFDDCKEYILYNVLESTGGLLANILPIDSFGENGQAAKIKSLIFWNGHTYSDLANQCAILEDFAQLAQEFVAANVDMMDPESRNIPFDLMMGTLKYVADELQTDSGKFVRSGLMSELMNNIIYNSLVSTLNLEPGHATLDALYDMFYPTGAPYSIINIVEARGLSGLIGMLEASNYSDNVDRFIEVIEANMPQLGPIDTTSISQYDEQADGGKYKGYNALAQKIYNTSYSGTLHNHNSKIALLLFATYAEKVEINLSIPTQFGSVSRTFTLAQLAEAAGLDLDSDTFCFESLSNEVCRVIRDPSSLLG